MARRKPDDYEPDADDEQIDEGDGQLIVAWGIEVVTSKPREKSHMFSARRVVLDGESVFVELSDGQTITYTIDQVRKILAMRSTLPPESADEI